jgi:2-polyprenyl-3-methyl-5-hydroxy-6-metoxy-1,4-benzoquinol methylase
MTTPHGRHWESLDGVPCPICRRAEATGFADVCDRLFGLVPGSFLLVRCLACLCVFQHPLPPAERLTSFYPDAYWWDAAHGAPARVQSWLLKMESIYREFVSRGHVRFLRRCARGRPSGEWRLLDIGCGSGTILSLARAAGFDAFGMDVSEAAVAAARRNYGLEVRQGRIGDTVWGGARFDFISMFHVLEHLPDPGTALNYAISLLRPGGSIVVQVPNIESVQAKVFGARWYGLDAPRHLINFSPEGLRLIMAQSGLRIVRQAGFSLRDNPASIASSLAPGLDPIGRRGRRLLKGAGTVVGDFLYLGLFLASVPFAWMESWMGRGGTIWVEARKTRDLGDEGRS